MARATTLWGGGADTAVDAKLFDYTAGDDYQWDARLLRWDILAAWGTSKDSVPRGC